MYGFVESYNPETGIGVVKGFNGDVLFAVDPQTSRVWMRGDRVKYTEGVRAINLQPDLSYIESDNRL
jgi:hypothetical protein